MRMPCYFLQGEDASRDLVRSRRLGAVYKGQELGATARPTSSPGAGTATVAAGRMTSGTGGGGVGGRGCSQAARPRRDSRIRGKAVECRMGMAGKSRRPGRPRGEMLVPVSYTHLRAHETVLDLVCRLLLEKKNKPTHYRHYCIITVRKS